MKKAKKSAIIWVSASIIIIAAIVWGAVITSRPGEEMDERTLVGIDNPKYDPKKDPNNPFNDDNRDKEGNYFYENKDLGFNITLPPEFIYFQTQRTDGDFYSDLEIFIPTSDPLYTHAVPPSYARPILVRVWDDLEAWQGENHDEYIIFGERDNRVYTMQLWEEPTSDWTDKWSDEMEAKLKQAVKML